MTAKKLLPERAISARRRRRGDDVGSAAEARDAILVAGNVLAGAFDLFDALAKKKPFLVAAKDVLRKTKRRAKAIADADKEPETP